MSFLWLPVATQLAGEILSDMMSQRGKKRGSQASEQTRSVVQSAAFVEKIVIEVYFQERHSQLAVELKSGGQDKISTGQSCRKSVCEIK